MSLDNGAPGGGVRLEFRSLESAKEEEPSARGADLSLQNTGISSPVLSLCARAHTHTRGFTPFSFCYFLTPKHHSGLRKHHLRSRLGSAHTRGVNRRQEERVHGATKQKTELGRDKHCLFSFRFTNSHHRSWGWYFPVNECGRIFKPCFELAITKYLTLSLLPLNSILIEMKKVNDNIDFFSPHGVSYNY